MKSRRVKIVLVAIGGLLAVLGIVWLSMPRRAPLSDSVITLGYTKALSGEIIATLSLTNMGLQPFSLITIGNVVAMVRDKDRAAGPVAQVVYQPGLLSAQARRLDIVLPGGTQSWHATLSIFEPGARVRARSWLEKHWFRKGILYSLTQLLPPNRFGLTAKVVTPNFQVPSDVASP